MFLNLHKVSDAMLEDFRLKVFMTVAAEKSFTKAAYTLSVTQPAISQNIAELERSLGTKLFERLKGETRLTTEGEVFMKYAERMVSIQQEAVNIFAKLPQTTVRISASEEIYSHLIAPALEKFSKIHPEIIFERALFDDSDLTVTLEPSSGSPFEIPAGSIARMRISMFPTPKLGDLSATQDKTSYFDVIYQPSPAFSGTRLCRLLKDFLIS